MGFTVYIYFVYKVGGLTTLWSSLNSRVEQTAGLGYFQRFYTFSVVLGSLLCLYDSRRKKDLFLSYLLILISIFILGSLGQRNPVLSFIFSIILCYHYTKKRIAFQKFFNIRNVVLVFLLLFFSIVSVQFRTPGALGKYLDTPGDLVEDSVNTFEQQGILRLGRLERDLVILKYFDANDHWWGGTYYSLLVAPIPRSFYPDKPPLDTGRYVVAISQGQKLSPPVGLSYLPPTSSPEGNWIGYMDFSVFGFISAFLLSGYFLGWSYQFVKYNNFSFISVFIYSIFSWNGGITITPGDISSVLTTLFFLRFYTFLM
jgi:hypothetical protein